MFSWFRQQKNLFSSVAQKGISKVLAGIVSACLVLQLFPFSYHASHAADTITLAHTIAIGGIEYDANNSLTAPTVISGTAVTYYLESINHSVSFTASNFKLKDTLPGSGLSGSLDCKYIFASASTTHTSLNFDSAGSTCTIASTVISGSTITSSLAADTGLFVRIQGYSATASNFNTGFTQGVLNGAFSSTTDYAYVNVAQGTITGHVFYDNGAGGGTAGNGTQDGGEADASSILMVADNGSATFEDTSDSSGNYSITVPPGTYSVTVDASNGYTVSTTDPTTGLVVTDGGSTSAGIDGLLHSADVSLTMIVDYTAPLSGSDITYTITVNNSGPEVATLVYVQDILPPELTYVSHIESQGFFSNSSHIWNVGTLSIGGSATLSITATTSGTATFTNAAEVYSMSQVDPDSTPNNSDTGEDDYDSVDATPAGAPSSDPTTITGSIFHDENDNGINDSEDGMRDLTVTLHDVTDDISFTTTTTSTGAYLFSDSNATLTAGHSYTVRVTIPSGYTESTSTNGDSFTLASGANPFADIGLYDPASISGKVFYDDNHDGLQSGSEAGVEGATVYLLSSTGSTLQTKTTDGSGHYNFAQLTHNDYGIKFSDLPTDYFFTLSNVGSDTDIDSDADNDGNTAEIHATEPTVVITHIDAGVLFKGNSIGDRFFLDSNRDGIQDSEETTGISGTVTLYDGNDDSEVASTSSDSDGAYQFTDVNNTICEGTNTSWTSGSSIDYTCSGLQSGGKHVLNFSTDTFCSADQNSITLTSGADNVLYTDNCDTGTLTNNSHYQIVVDDTDGGTATLHLTDTFGNGGIYNLTWQYSNFYLQFNAPDSSYAFSAADATSDELDSDVNSGGTTPHFAILPGTSNSDLDAGAYILDSSISGKVFLDENRDDISNDVESGVSDQSVNLYTSTGAYLATATTDGSGEYSFDALVPGSYQVKFSSPTGYIFSAQHGSGSTTDNDSDANSDTGYTDAIEITGNQTIVHIDAGIRLNFNTIGDFVFNDNNQDGLQDSGESGIANVTVELYQGDDLLPVATTTTDTDGRYVFTYVPFGLYHVHFTLPTGFVFSAQHSGDDSSKDSDANSETGNTEAFFLSGGQDFTSIDAGMYEPTSEPTPTASADVSLIQTITTTTPPWINSTITYRITVTNDGPNTASGIVITDLLPSGLNYLTATTSSGSYISSSGLWTIGDMANDSAATLDISAQIVSNSTLTTIAEITADETDDPDSTANNHNASEDDYSAVSITPLLGILHAQTWVIAEGSNPSGEFTDTDGPMVGAGAPLSYYIDLNNTSSGAALTGITVADSFPTSLGSDDWTCEYSSSDNSTLHNHAFAYDHTCSVDGANITAIPHTINPDSSIHIRLSGKVVPNTITDNFCNTILASADFELSATSQACLAIAKPSIQIINTATPTNPRPGDSVIYTLTITNQSAYTAYNVTILDDLDNVLAHTNLIPACISTIADITAFNDGTIESATNTIHWSIGQLGSDSTQSVSFQGRIRTDLDSTMTCRNTAEALGSNTTTVSSTATINVPVVSNEAIIHFNQHLANQDTTLFVPGDNLQYQIDISNSGTADLNDLNVTDVLPRSLDNIHNIIAPAGTITDSNNLHSASVLHSAAANSDILSISNLDMVADSNKTISYFATIADAEDFPLRTYHLHANADKTDNDFYPERIRSSTNDQNSDNALSAPDNQTTTLGPGGEMIVEVGRNSATGKVLVDGDGPDFCILEQDTNDSDAATEKYSVAVAQTNHSSDFERIGHSSSNSNCYDLADADMLWARYIRITDTSPHFENSTGVDIDAVCLLQIGGFVTNTAVLYNGNTILGTSNTDVLVNFTDAFEHPLRPRDCRSTGTPVVTITETLPTPPTDVPVVLPIHMPFTELPKTGTEGSILLSSIISIFWWVRRRK